MAGTELAHIFQTGEVVVYPSHGLGVITAKEDRNGKVYLKVKIEETDSTVLLPEDNAGVLGLRPLSNKETIEEALECLKDRTKIISTDWKQRFQDNQALMKDGSLSSIAMVINSLYRRSKVKELPSQERRMYDSALSMLVEEASSVLNKKKEEVRRLIFSKLEMK